MSFWCALLLLPLLHTLSERLLGEMLHLSFIWWVIIAVFILQIWDLGDELLGMLLDLLLRRQFLNLLLFLLIYFIWGTLWPLSDHLAYLEIGLLGIVVEVHGVSGAVEGPTDEEWVFLVGEDVHLIIHSFPGKFGIKSMGISDICSAAASKWSLVYRYVFDFAPWGKYGVKEWCNILKLASSALLVLLNRQPRAAVILIKEF